MLKLYSAPRTRGIRIAWLLEEMGMDYELVNGEFQPTESTFFIQQTPTGKFPTIDDDGFIMFESGAITEYLLEKFPDTELAPHPGTPQRGEFLQWIHFADATAFSPLGIVIWLALYRDDADQHQTLIEDARSRARTGFTQLSKHLGDRQWLLGDNFSAADIMNGFTLMVAQALGILEDDQVLVDYLGRLMARPAYQRAAERTGNA